MYVCSFSACVSTSLRNLKHSVLRIYNKSYRKGRISCAYCVRRHAIKRVISKPVYLHIIRALNIQAMGPTTIMGEGLVQTRIHPSLGLSQRTRSGNLDFAVRGSGSYPYSSISDLTLYERRLLRATQLFEVLGQCCNLSSTRDICMCAPSVRECRLL